MMSCFRHLLKAQKLALGSIYIEEGHHSNTCHGKEKLEFQCIQIKPFPLNRRNYLDPPG